MKLGMQVGLGHIVLEGDRGSPPPKGHSPSIFEFSAHICCGQIALWIKMPLGTKVGLDPSDIALDEDPAPLPKKAAQPPHPQFRPMFVVAKRLNGSRCHLVRRYASAQAALLHGEPAPPPNRGTAPNFRPMSIVTKRRPSQLLLSTCFTYTPFSPTYRLDPSTDFRA